MWNWFIRKTIKITFEMKKKTVEEYRESKISLLIVLQILSEKTGNQLSLVYFNCKSNR